MTYSALMWTLAAVFLVGAITAVDIVRERREVPVFVSGTGPVTEEQVCDKMAANGWSNVEIAREGRYFQATGSKDGETGHISIDSQTGPVRDDDADGN
jgi:hypothetical protein